MAESLLSLLVVITRDFPLFGIFATNLAQKWPLRKSTDEVPTLYKEIRCDFNETYLHFKEKQFQKIAFLHLGMYMFDVG